MIEEIRERGNSMRATSQPQTDAAKAAGWLDHRHFDQADEVGSPLHGLTSKYVLEKPTEDRPSSLRVATPVQRSSA